MVKRPRPKPLCDGDCFNCVFADCTNNYPSAINDLEMQTRKDGQKHKKPVTPCKVNTLIKKGEKK